MPETPKWKTRLVEGRFLGREFDIAFWQEQGDTWLRFESTF